MNGIITLKSEYCLQPGNCIEIKTEVPIWMLIILFGSSYLILKEVYQLIQS